MIKSSPRVNVMFQFNDGGRSKAGLKGETSDCVTRAIAIATGSDYLEIYNQISSLLGKGRSPRDGVHRKVWQPYIESLGFKWAPTMKIGQGCKVHLRAEELPSGIIIASVSKHLCAVIDGVVHDTQDCSRGGTRCVYGYFKSIKESNND